jgi:hypothetical protein
VGKDLEGGGCDLREGSVPTVKATISLRIAVPTFKLGAADYTPGALPAQRRGKFGISYDGI